MYQTLKCIQRLLYEEIKRPYQKSVFWVFFSMLGTKTINNKELTLYGKAKQNYWKRVSVLRKKNAKTDANQPISRSRKTLPKRYILSVFELVTYKKKRENWCKALYIEKERDIARKVYESFIVQKNNKAKNAKTCVYGVVS